MVNGQIHGRGRCNSQSGSEILLKISREFGESIEKCRCIIETNVGEWTVATLTDR